MPRLIALLGALLLGACSSTQVAVDRDPTYDFAGRTTYAWTDGAPAESALVQRRITDEVDAALSARGMRRVDEQPALLVRTKVASRQEVRSSGDSVGASYARSWGRVGVSSGPRVYEVKIGELVIELLDGPTAEVVWRSVAEDTVDNDPETLATAIREAVERSFEDFPPAD